ncbi:MAG: UDP-N-acetylmuramate dehydrogenase [Candidatus Omnitrophica bacterium]|nr:UDP-N-acetylmuramate dehydrogenase [Candidatus Omnitrophota bacterium]MDD5078793.1 UDP-N-acetylmuramate dehydrogenase [Candidatus Omnitrophota bacterium]
MPLKGYTTFRIGGPAELLAKANDPRELRDIVRLAKAARISARVIGAGSNILAGDKGVKGLVIKLDSFVFKRISLEGSCRVRAGAGVLLSRFISFCRLKSLSGAEFLAGIPGTIGGGLVMNAGISVKGGNSKTGERTIADLVETVRVMDYNGEIKELKAKEIKFAYRDSGLSRYIVLEAVFRLRKRDKTRILREIREYIARRRQNQDYSYPSAGCVFRNPAAAALPAGKLIDRSGLKGKKIGSAAVSLKHANFIINLGNARAKDVLNLILLIKKQVKRDFKVNLETEIRIWK